MSKDGYKPVENTEKVVQRKHGEGHPRTPGTGSSDVE